MNMNAVAASPETCKCPTCGAMLHDQYKWDSDRRTFVGDGAAVRFTKTQALIVDALWRARTRGGIPSLERFMEAAYCGELDGGPDSPTTISVHLAHIRSKLRAVGYTVSLNYGSPRGGYRIVKIEGET